MTFDDIEWPLRTLFQNTCVFGAHHEHLNEGRPILSQPVKNSTSSVITGYFSEAFVDLVVTVEKQAA